MKKKKLVDLIGAIDDKYIIEAEPKKEKEYLVVKNKRMKNVFIKRIISVACVGILAISAFLAHRFLVPKQDDLIGDRLENPIISEDNKNIEELGPDEKDVGLGEAYVNASDLIVDSSDAKEEILITTRIKIEKYEAIYSKVDAISSEDLDKSKGKNVGDLRDTFHISGHNDLQYIIQKADDGTYELFKFQNFACDEYPYSDVLKLIYGIDSEKDIISITVEPADMDNTDAGKKIQNEIGTLSVTNPDDIRDIYKIISTMICYGDDNWDMIDYGANDVSMVESVRQGRYLTFNLANKSTIDGLKYTGISGMFYEYSGIAYNRLNDIDKETVEQIIDVNK
ncbi:MAG: hypothetical protein GX974_07405 [Clostridiales bacterium]|nr:hypothetical protein [Clostridiales bacterium]